MLPVQTVMIRYMVLVYRWGSGWLGAAGAQGGALDGAVTGGCARRRGAAATRPGREKAPPTVGLRGLKYEPYSAGFSSSPSLDLSNGFAGLLTRVYS